jgi:hypothetical protein
LKGQWTAEASQDIKAYQGIDLESDITSLMAESVAREMDLEVLDMIASAVPAGGSREYWSAENNTMISSDGNSIIPMTSGFYNSQAGWFQTLGTKINKVSNKILQKTVRGEANFMVISPTVANAVESMSGYMSDAEVGKVQKNFADYFEKNQNDAILRSYKAIPVSPQQTGNFGALALTNIRVVGTTPVIFVSTMIVEKSRPGQLDPSQQHIDGQTVDVFVAVADAYTENFLAQISDEVKRQYGKPEAQIIDCGYQVIYDLTPLDPEQFQPVIDEAINAIDHAMDMIDPSRPVFSLNMIVANPAIRVRSRVALNSVRMSERIGKPLGSVLY